jgi:hypothetical protein
MPLTKDDMLGAWVLDEWYIEGEGGARTHPMGRDAQGSIVYTEDGYMSAIVRAKDRFLPADQPADKDQIEAFSTYFNYAGSWDIDDNNNVIHMVEHSLDPNMQELTIIRAVDHEGARMTLSGATPSSTGTHIIVWKRR